MKRLESNQTEQCCCCCPKHFTIDDGQGFDCPILGSADNLTGTTTIEMHQSQLLKSNQSRRSIQSPMQTFLGVRHAFLPH